MFSKNRTFAIVQKAVLITGAAATLVFVGVKAEADNNWLGAAALSQVRATIDQLSNKNTDLYDEYQQASQDLLTSQNTVNDLNNQLSNLKQQLSDKQNELNNTVATMSAEKQQELAAKDAEIQAKIDEVNQAIADGNQKVADKQKEIDSLNTQLQAASANDQQLQQALDDANKTKDYAQNALNNSK